MVLAVVIELLCVDDLSVDGQNSNDVVDGPLAKVHADVEVCACGYFFGAQQRTLHAAVEIIERYNTGVCSPNLAQLNSRA